MNGRFSELYVDDDGYISFDHTIDRNIALTWHISGYGWQIYRGDVFIQEFQDTFTFPTEKMISDVENIFNYIRATNFGNWEVSWISDKTYSREHKQFDEFESAFNLYKDLYQKGEL